MLVRRDGSFLCLGFPSRAAFLAAHIRPPL
jgi:hypothetical protein